MTATLHRDNWEQYAAICELKIASLEAEIERLTGCAISVYGKTIGIVGETDNVAIARQAVAMLLQGSMHKTVYQFLERKKKEILFG